MAVVFIVVGTRPNFVKVTQFKRVARESFPEIEIKFIHTGQHYDAKMAKVFFSQFGLQPDYFLDLTPAHPAQQVAAIIDQLTTLLIKEKPDLLMAVGDVNSTLAAAVAANKCQIPLAHLESGLRSFDASMPEEHNRRVADLLADLYFVTEDSGLENLRNEGVKDNAVCFTGNTMIDTLCAFDAQIEASNIHRSLAIADNKYGLVTIHRPATTDNPQQLKKLISLLRQLCHLSRVILPLHPRTRHRLAEFDLLEDLENLSGLTLTEPMDYFDFQKLIKDSSYVLTDSGGIQEETSYLGIPCLTLRENTERPVTISLGTNQLVAFDTQRVYKLVEEIFSGSGKRGTEIPLWDGRATDRVLTRIRKFFETGC